VASEELGARFPGIGLIFIIRSPRFVRKSSTDRHQASVSRFPVIRQRGGPARRERDKGCFGVTRPNARSGSVKPPEGGRGAPRRATAAPRSASDSATVRLVYCCALHIPDRCGEKSGGDGGRSRRIAELLGMRWLRVEHPAAPFGAHTAKEVPAHRPARAPTPGTSERPLPWPRQAPPPRSVASAALPKKPPSPPKLVMFVFVLILSPGRLRPWTGAGCQ